MLAEDSFIAVGSTVRCLKTQLYCAVALLLALHSPSYTYAYMAYFLGFDNNAF